MAGETTLEFVPGKGEPLICGLELSAEDPDRITAITPEDVLRSLKLDRAEVVTLPEQWIFKLDAEDKGVKGRWADPALDVSDWKPIRTDKDKGWNGQGFDNPTPAYGWYRIKLPLTKKQLEGKKHLYLHFGAADEDAYVYLNGRMIFEHSGATTGLPIEDIWTTPFSVPLKSDFNRNGENWLVVRVRNTSGMGGLWKPVHVVLNDKELSPGQLKKLFKIRGWPGSG